MAVVLGLLVALAYGSGDFCGGIASTRSRPSAVVIGSFLVSTVCLVVVTVGWWIVGGLPAASEHDLVLGLVVGCIGPLAVGLLYRGLALGRMSVVAPITAVVAAVVPFAWGLLHGERPSGIAVAGALVALVAVGLISGAPAHPDDDTVVDSGVGSVDLIATSVASGLGFGVIFVLLAQVSDDAGLWPLFSARVVAVALSVSSLAIWCRVRPQPLGPHVVPVAGSWGAVAGAGTLDITANAIYLSATRHGLLSIVAVLSSLYPAATVVLARIVLGERLHRAQLVGLLLAAAGVGAMAAS